MRAGAGRFNSFSHLSMRTDVRTRIAVLFPCIELAPHMHCQAFAHHGACPQRHAHTAWKREFFFFTGTSARASGHDMLQRCHGKHRLSMHMAMQRPRISSTACVHRARQRAHTPPIHFPSRTVSQCSRCHARACCSSMCRMCWCTPLATPWHARTCVGSVHCSGDFSQLGHASEHAARIAVLFHALNQHCTCTGKRLHTSAHDHSAMRRPHGSVIFLTGSSARASGHRTLQRCYGEHRLSMHAAT